MLFAGPFSNADTGLIGALLRRGRAVLAVDRRDGGELHDVLQSPMHGMGDVLLQSCRRGDFEAMHAAVPCETWSVALDDADMVRSVDYPMGVMGLSASAQARLWRGNALLYYALEAAHAVFEAGGEVTIENPAPRCVVELAHVYWKEKSHHASLFCSEPVIAYAAATGSRLATLPLCACGADMQKYVSVLATKRAAAVMDPVDGIVCAHASHGATAYGMSDEGVCLALRSGEYGQGFGTLVASALLGGPMPRVRRDGVSPTVMAGALGVFTTAAYGGACEWQEERDPSAEFTLAARGATEAFAGETLDDEYTREELTTLPGYVAPDNPGWWVDDEADLSDEECDVAVAEVGGMSVAFQSCMKRQVDASAVGRKQKIRWSMGDDGKMLRHEVPKGYSEMRRHPEQAALWEAMLREYSSHIDCGTWELRPAQECYDSQRTPIDCSWVYDAKVDCTTNEFVMWKARLIARGDQMQYLQDFLETYAGVVRYSSLRTLLAVAAMKDLRLTSADVSTAYLHAPLRDVVVWMRQPRGMVQTYDVKGEDGTIVQHEALCRLRMAIYGLRQSAREWAITLIGWLLAWGFTRCVSDRYMFVWATERGVVYLLLWVDDFFLADNDSAMRAEFMGAVQQRFRVKDLGEMRQALGGRVAQSLADGQVSFDLGKYIQDVARRWGVEEDSALADIPLPLALARECTQPVPDAEVAEVQEETQCIVGSVVFVSSVGRPDCAFAAHFLGRYQSRPGYAHRRAARRVLVYLLRTRDLCLTYRRSAAALQTVLKVAEPEQATGKAGRVPQGVMFMPVDADHAVDRSVTGWVVLMAGAAVVWAVRRQLQPALSSAEAELYGLSTAVCDLLSAMQVAEELGIKLDGKVGVLCDSRGARLLAQDCSAAARTRHVHRRWYFVQHHCGDDGGIAIDAVSGGTNIANILTKAVGGEPFMRCRAVMLGGGMA